MLIQAKLHLLSPQSLVQLALMEVVGLDFLRAAGCALFSYTDLKAAHLHITVHENGIDAVRAQYRKIGAQLLDLDLPGVKLPSYSFSMLTYKEIVAHYSTSTTLGADGDTWVVMHCLSKDELRVVRLDCITHVEGTGRYLVSHHSGHPMHLALPPIPGSEAVSVSPEGDRTWDRIATLKENPTFADPKDAETSIDNDYCPSLHP